MIAGREDVEVFLFSVGIGSFAGFAAMKWIPYETVGDAVLVSGMSGSLTFAAVYGVRSLGRSLPHVAGGVFDFLSLQRSARLEAQAEQSVGPAPRRSAPPRYRLPEVVADDKTSIEDRWRIGLRQFLLASKIEGAMTFDALVGQGGYMSDPAYRKYSRVLAINGIIEKSQAGTDYAPGWNYARATFHLKHEHIEITEGGEPPRIRWEKPPAWA